MKALKKYDADARFRGFGGDLMRDSGLQLVKHYNELAVMGFWEVIKNINRFAKLLGLCQKDIIAYEPDVLILVDFSGFNLRLAKRIDRNSTPIAYYIAPKVWAWNQQRAKKIKKHIDLLLCILPFETTFFNRYTIPNCYVGNPLVKVIDEYKKQHPQKKRIARRVAVLPGSRKQEVTNILNKVLDVVDDFPDFEFVIAGVNNLPRDIYDQANAYANTKVVFEETYNLLNEAEYAIVTSGTATLETALFGVPQVVCYKTSPVSYAIGKMVVKVRFISLVNLLLDKPLVTELIQQDLNRNNLKLELNKLQESNNLQTIKKGYQDLYNLLTERDASDEAAGEIYHRLILKRPGAA
jgi:lipid-A-disaccharide synthase